MIVLVVGPDRQDPGGVANYYNAVFPRLSGEGVETHYLAIGSTHGRKSRLHIIGDQIRLWKTIGRLRPDVVHLNPSLDFRSYIRDGIFIFLAKLRSRLVLVFFRGWQIPFEKKISAGGGWFFRITYARADAFAVLARNFSMRLREWGVTVPIHLGTTAVADELLNGFSINEKAENIGNAKVVRLLYLARLERYKGVLELIDAVKLLLNRGVQVSLTIAGEGPMSKQVRNKVANLQKYKDIVQITGYVRGHDKKEVLRSHHVYCFPTQYGEGMPNSVLEAMAFGMPVITCPVGGISDIFENNKMGALLSKVEPGYMAEAIESLIVSRDNLAEIAYYNYNFAQRRFLASNVAKNLRAYYKEMYPYEVN